MIFDMRLRPPYESFLNTFPYAQEGYYPSHIGHERPESALRRSMELLIVEMDSAGITTGLLVGRRNSVWGTVENDHIRELIEHYPGRFVGLWGVDVAQPELALDELGSRRDNRIKGISLEPALAIGGPLQPDDPRFEPLYQYCEENSLVVSFTLSGQVGPRIDCASPLPVQPIARKHPNLRIVISHGGWPYVLETLALAFICPNVWVSPDQYLNVPNMPGATEYMKAANYFLGDRLLFGSSYPSKPLRYSVDGFRAIGWPMDLEGKILYENAARLFEL